VADPAQGWMAFGPGINERKWLRTASVVAKRHLAERQNEAFGRRIERSVAGAFRQVVSLYRAEIKAFVT
jgi:hypothetical protein